MLFERCQREKEGEEEERSFKGEKEEKKKKQRGVRDDECAAGLQPLQFAGAERRFLSWLVLTCSAAGFTAPRGVWRSAPPYGPRVSRDITVPD